MFLGIVLRLFIPNGKKTSYFLLGTHTHTHTHTHAYLCLNLGMNASQLYDVNPLPGKEAAIRGTKSSIFLRECISSLQC